MITKSIAPAIHQAGRLVLVVVLGLAAVANARAEDATQAQRVTCAPDVVRLCPSDIPTAAAIKACVMANRTRLSVACRNTLPRVVASE
jgi:hypothetical protein